MSRLAFVVALLALLFASDAVEARSKSRFKPGRYYEIGQQEYADGVRRLASIPGTAPQQVYTTLGLTSTTITVTWVTFNLTDSYIQYGAKPGQYSVTAHGDVRKFVDPNPGHIVRYMHTARMTELEPKSLVYYRVGANATSGWSTEFEFAMPPAGNELLNLIVYGDMGVVNAQSMQQVIAEVESGAAHMVLHLGDYAYDLHTNDGAYGDVFFNNIMPISTRVPYLGCEGNHEGKYNATHYTERLSAMTDLGIQSGSGNNWWFSWDYISGDAKVHFVAIDTEMYYTYVDNEQPPDYTQQRRDQYHWLDGDLAQARKNSDWVIVYGHRPMYCSDVDSFGDCTSDATLLREGFTNETNGMDDMIGKHGVDIYFTAHEHSYERTLPVCYGDIDYQANHTYVNPRHPVHIITGSAGCQEGLEWFDDVNFPAWSVVRSPTYGYGHLMVHNRTHLHWDQLLDEGRGGLDELWIIRDQQPKAETGTAPSERVTVATD